MTKSIDHPFSVESIGALQEAAGRVSIESGLFSPVPINEDSKSHLSLWRDHSARVYQQRLSEAGLSPGSHALRDHAFGLMDSYAANERAGLEWVNRALYVHYQSMREEAEPEGFEAFSERVEKAQKGYDNSVDRAHILSQVPAIGSLSILRCVWPFHERAFGQADEKRAVNLADLLEEGAVIKEKRREISSTILPSTSVPGLSARHDKILDADITLGDRQLHVMTEIAYLLAQTPNKEVEIPGVLSQSVVTPGMLAQQRKSGNMRL